MKNRTFRGTGVALVTPFSQDEQPDYTAYKRLIDHVSQKNGVDYLVVQGTTGESVTTTAKEKQELLAFTLENNTSGLPVVFGIGANNTATVLDSLKSTSLEGVDAILSVSPYYNKPSQEGIFRHYTEIADASPVPIILYNVPGRTASNISAETTLKLAEHENIIGTKEASGLLDQAMEISRHKPDSFYLISGDDMLTVPLLSIGAEGVISVLANGFPTIFHDMVHNALKGDFEKASKAAFRLMDINPLMYAESNPVGIKAVLEELGICEGHVRMPLLPASEELKKDISHLMNIM